MSAHLTRANQSLRWLRCTTVAVLIDLTSYALAASSVAGQALLEGVRRG